MAYVTISLAWKLKTTHPHLGDYPDKINDKWLTKTSWIPHLSISGLTTPSNVFLGDVTKFEEVFCDMQKEKVDKTRRVLERLTRALTVKCGVKYPLKILKYYAKNAYRNSNQSSKHEIEVQEGN
ncbi:unnamed protein product [Lepeophtheirus salmonis]|uniref:(salmon louse) hypothetical protein n=1 Tax=Lepeophtheirus salmonis TaxID=72036 RepID=A0A7R8HCX4_LEPSM|nr:unnamed protein product [Lepeophtheirus salmonis]CAF3023346.1 unnamed protein product [Lepeophtheirus salmonis]